MFGTQLRSSILDHIYVKNVSLVKNVMHIKPCFGDHELILAEYYVNRAKPVITKRRVWRQYSKELLCAELGSVDWVIQTDSVQEMWNSFENKLIQIVDAIAPIKEFHGDNVSTRPCPIMKRKLNLRNRLLKHLKNRPTVDLKLGLL